MCICPACGGRDIGRVGSGRYYCRDCCVEFAYKQDQLKIYSVADDGTLLQYAGRHDGMIPQTG